MTSYVYALECQENRFYIGKTTTPDARIAAHFGGIGSVFTRTYAPVGICECKPTVTEYDEDNLVKTYMRRYGIENVRGGSYTTLRLSRAEIEILEREIGTSTDACFKCGRVGHFANRCIEDYVGSDSESDTGCARCGRESHTAETCYAKRDILGRTIN